VQHGNRIAVVAREGCGGRLAGALEDRVRELGLAAGDGVELCATTSRSPVAAKPRSPNSTSALRIMRSRTSLRGSSAMRRP
jgi:hypothetical protein